MLIFKRRLGEAVVIGDNVTLRILSVKGTQVRVGINAPKEVPVHREEVYDRIKRKSESSAALRQRPAAAT